MNIFGFALEPTSGDYFPDLTVIKKASEYDQEIPQSQYNSSSLSIPLSKKFILLINVKMPTISLHCNTCTGSELTSGEEWSSLKVHSLQDLQLSRHGLSL